MAKTKKPKTGKNKVQVKDLEVKKADKAKGGAYEFYVTIEGAKSGRSK